MLKEKALEYRLTTNKIMISLISKKGIYNKIGKILEKIRESIGWIHIGFIHMIIRSTYRERLNTPIDLAVTNNQIKNREEVILGIVRRNLKYQILIFNIYPNISYNIQDKDLIKHFS
mgnify:CR=1 FL=1